MARHNEVTMYGQVLEAPRLRYNSSDPTATGRKLIQAMGYLAILRGIRDFGAVDKRVRTDIPIILSQNDKIMKLMATWEVGDIIELRGTLATVNIKKNLRCPHCGAVDQLESMLSFINPIFMKTEFKKLDAAGGNKEIRKNSEISNRITVIGTVCTAPELFVTDKGQKITNYQLDVPRKYRIKEDDETNRHDFPFVKSYGFVADNDYRAISEGSMVFVDGAIQTRDYIRKHTCSQCGEEYEYLQTATEIVPYSTEYLIGCKTMEEIEEEKRQKLWQLERQREKIFLESYSLQMRMMNNIFLSHNILLIISLSNKGIEREVRKMKKILIMLFAAIFCISGILLIKNELEKKAARDSYEALQESMADSIQETEPIEAAPTPEMTEETEPAYQAPGFLNELMEENPSVIGWMTIADTNVNYPIVQNKEDNEYFLHRDINGEESISGSIYLDSNHDINARACIRCTDTI